MNRAKQEGSKQGAEAPCALFDMDGTLFAGDSQLRFARWVLQRHPLRRLYLLLLLPAALLRLLHILNTERMKRLFLCYAWGMKQERLAKECRDFVQQELLPESFPEVLERLRALQAAGRRCVLCSASPDWWTRPFGQALGFDLVIGSPIAPTERVPLAPKIPAPGNNKGSNKLIRLDAAGICHAEIGFSDSAADLPMLSICQSRVLINPKDGLLRQLPEAEVIRTQRRVCLPIFALRCVLGL